MTTPKKKSKRRKKSRAGEPVLPARPAFAEAYPRDGELDRLVDAFERGHFRVVRSEAPRLAERTRDEEVRAAALDLRRRLDPDPIAVYLLALGVGLVLFLYAYYALFAH